jgi:hypothetical protein
MVAVVTSTATCTAFRAVDETTGEVGPTRVLVERVGFLAALAQAMTMSVVAARWNDGDLCRVGRGVGPDGRALPTKGWMALRRLGWHAAAPEGVYASDGVRRVTEGNVARARRSKRRTRAAQPQITRTTGKPAPRSSRRVSDRRAVPAPAAKVAGKRPAGQAPKTHDHRHAEIGSGPANDRLPYPCRSRRPGAGWGFHHNVAATAVLPLGDYGPATAWPRLSERLNHSGTPWQSETLPEDLP